MRKPTLAQTQWLHRIALSPLMKTYIDGEPQPRFSLVSGETVPFPTASLLIRNGWVRPQRDGLFDDPQTYVALKP